MIKKGIRICIFATVCLLFAFSMSSCSSNVQINHLDEVDWSRYCSKYYAFHNDAMFYLESNNYITSLKKAEKNHIETIDSEVSIFRSSETGFVFDGSMQIIDDNLYVSGIRTKHNKTTTSIAIYDLNTNKTKCFIDFEKNIDDLGTWRIFDHYMIYHQTYSEDDQNDVEGMPKLYIIDLSSDALESMTIADCVLAYKIIGETLFYVQVKEGVCSVFKCNYEEKNGGFTTSEQVYQRELDFDVCVADVSLMGVYINPDYDNAYTSYYYPFDDAAQDFVFHDVEQLTLFDKSAFWISNGGELFHTDLNNSVTTSIGTGAVEIGQRLYPISNDDVCVLNDRIIIRYSIGASPKTILHII